MNTELDAEVAREVMGWTMGAGEGGKLVLLSAWHPSSDMNAAFEMEAAIPENLRSRYTHHLYKVIRGTGIGTHYFGTFDLVHATPEQRCRAALATIRRT